MFFAVNVLGMSKRDVYCFAFVKPCIICFFCKFISCQSFTFKKIVLSITYTYLNLLKSSLMYIEESGCVILEKDRVQSNPIICMCIAVSFGFLTLVVMTWTIDGWPHQFFMNFMLTELAHPQLVPVPHFLLRATRFAKQQLLHEVNVPHC